MRKLKLDLDALQVETFDTRPAHAGRGTVRGANELEAEYAITTPRTNRELDCAPLSKTCPPIDTLWATCPWSCPWTCQASCPPELCSLGCTEVRTECPTGDPVCCV